VDTANLSLMTLSVIFSGWIAVTHKNSHSPCHGAVLGLGGAISAIANALAGVPIQSEPYTCRCYSFRVVVSFDIPNKALIPPIILLKMANTKVVLNPTINGTRTITQSSIVGTGNVSKNA
jgi:hypothetical protein